jgi:hypothetical protein
MLSKNIHPPFFFFGPDFDDFDGGYFGNVGYSVQIEPKKSKNVHFPNELSTVLTSSLSK